MIKLIKLIRKYKNTTMIILTLIISITSLYINYKSNLENDKCSELQNQTILNIEKVKETAQEIVLKITKCSDNKITEKNINF